MVIDRGTEGNGSRQRDLGVWAVIWGILAGLSLLASVPLAIRRRRITSNVGVRSRSSNSWA
jgi:hypothetical protein